MKKTIFAIFMFLLMGIIFTDNSYACECSDNCTKKFDSKICQINKGDEIASKKAAAVLCGNCYKFKGGKDHCLKCGEWFSSGNGAMAVMCNNCYTFKGGKDHCMKCGEWTASNKATALICKNCYKFKGGKDHCIKCGEWVP